MAKFALAACFVLIAALESAAQVAWPAAPSRPFAEPLVLCGTTVIPANPVIDRPMVKPTPPGSFTLRTLAPRVCGPSSRALAGDLRLRLPRLLGPKR